MGLQSEINDSAESDRSVNRVKQVEAVNVDSGPWSTGATLHRAQDTIGKKLGAAPFPVRPPILSARDLRKRSDLS